MNRVLGAEDPLVRQVQRDFRVREGGRDYVVRLRGEGRFRSSVFPDLPHRPQVLLEYLPATEWRRPGPLRRWWQALRLPYLSFSLLPLLLVACTYLREHRTLPLALSALLFVSIALIHVSCNLWGDYEDHLRGIDATDHDGGSGVIQKLWIPARHLRNAAAALMLSGLAAGLALLATLPLSELAWSLFALGLCGSLGAASYSGWPFHYKYFGLGEPIVFFLSGPVVTVGAALLLFGGHGHTAWAALACLPLSFLATLRLHGGNTQRIPFDTMAGVFTIARALGFRRSKLAWGFLFFAPFLTVVALVIAGEAPRAALLSGLTLPLSLLAVEPLRQASGPLDPACHELRERGAQLHLAFGLLYAFSFLFA